MGLRRLGELLVAEGLLSESAIDRALGFQRASGERVRIGSILLDWDLLAEDALLETLALFHRCPAVTGAMLAAAPIEIVRLLSPAQAVRLAVIPYALEKSLLRVAFLNPSDLAAIDEISALTRKRIAPGVTTQIRLMQALQKLYGQHIPHEFRTIIQKLERRTGQTKRPTRPEKTAVPTPALGPNAESFPATGVAAPSGFQPTEPILVDPGLDSLSPPDLPRLAGAGSENQEASDLPPTVPPPRPRRRTDPVKTSPQPPDAVEREDPIRSGEDSLSEWVGEALTAFQGGIATPSKSTSSSPTNPGAQNGSALAAHPNGRRETRPPSVEAEESVSGMWRPSRLETSDEAVSGMWTSSEEEAGPQLWEARSREEIAEAVLQNALTFLPRVILFGVGKTEISGWSGRGPELTRKDVASVRIPAGAKSVFRTVKESGVPHFGLVDSFEWPPALKPMLGAVPVDCAVFPIRILDGVAAFLYADRLGHPMQHSDFPLIARAAAATANVLSRFLLKQNTPVG